MRTSLIVLAVCISIWLVSKFLLAVLARRQANRTQQPGGLVAPEAAARRALCLAALFVRAELEDLLTATRDIMGINLAGKGGARSLNEAGSERFNQWLRREGLWDSLSPKERGLMAADSGTWSARDTTDAAWRCEAAGAIAWAVGLVPEMPVWDVQFDHKALPKSIGMHALLSETLRRLSPRPEAEIRKMRDIAELWLWRARTTQLMKEKPSTPLPQGMTFDRIVRMSAGHAKEEGLFEPIGEDFPAFGKAYRDLSDDESSTMRSIAHERLYALNWLCGYASDWDDVRCDT